ncbi:MAG: prepilin-type N-terminal cleavage/methylation domain-containing protein [Dissulfurispiraceae bacterium]|jgi:prepilin-type N-terminal cleavage/methylation domain-containing protein
MGEDNRHSSYRLSPIAYRRSSSGFSLIEMSLALVIMSIILAASFKLINTYTMQTNVNQQGYYISLLAQAIKNNARLIMDAAMTECTQFMTTSYSNDYWGWRDSHCQNTSPFPAYNISTKVLTYNIDTANFASTVSTIIYNINPSCAYTGQTATTVTFNCAPLGITGLQYQTSVYPAANTYANTGCPSGTPNCNRPGIVSSAASWGGTTVTFSPPNTTGANSDFLNFLDFPSSVWIQYNEYLSNTGQTVSHNDMLNGSNPGVYAYSLNMTDLYLDREKKSRDNLVVLDAALRGYAIGNMTSEFENVPPNGLSSKDTFFVPWIWQALATTQPNTLTLCNNSTTCSSIASGAQWATASQAGSFADVWLLLTQNLMSSNLTYAADAFGNPLRIVPVNNGCTGNVSGCVPSTNLPPLPQQNYLTAMSSAGYAPRPPYASLIVSPLCTGGTTTYPDWCRWTVVYPN